MTIRDYLNQMKYYKCRMDRLDRLVTEQLDRATSIRSSSNYGDGIPGRGFNPHANEDRIIDYAEAADQYREAASKYKTLRDQIKNGALYLLHWEGLLITQVYIYNVCFNEEDPFYGVNDLLNIGGRKEIDMKLREAEKHLAKILRSEGIDVE